ncbi:MAG: toxic anion resistance protein [Rhizobacter sp.]|nr:toxic anion resistance protein [Rhizobacter sp.]
MTGPEDTPTIANPATPNFLLAAPQVITPVPAEATLVAVPLRAERSAAVAQEAQRLIDTLLSGDLGGKAVKAGLDRAAAIGREELGAAWAFMQGGVMQPGFAAARETTACRTLSHLRGLLVPLEPGHHGDMLAAGKVLGLIPVGDGLKAYFRAFAGDGVLLHTSLVQLCAARSELQRDMADIEAHRGRLWDTMQGLAAAAQLAVSLDHRLSARGEQLRAEDPPRARVIEHDLLPATRSRLAALLAQLACCVNAYLALDVLKKAGREMLKGCGRVVTTCLGALAVAQTVARATGHPMTALEQAQAANTTLDRFIAEAGHRVDGRSQRSDEFARHPQRGLDAMKEALAQAFKSIDAMEAFRAQVMAVAAQNSAIVAASQPPRPMPH